MCLFVFFSLWPMRPRIMNVHSLVKMWSRSKSNRFSLVTTTHKHTHTNTVTHLRMYIYRDAKKEEEAKEAEWDKKWKILCADLWVPATMQCIKSQMPLYCNLHRWPTCGKRLNTEQCNELCKMVCGRENTHTNDIHWYALRLVHSITWVNFRQTPSTTTVATLTIFERLFILNVSQYTNEWADFWLS